jgi:hypothetical protein
MNTWNEYKEQRFKELEQENKQQRALIELYDNLLNELQFPVSMVYKVKEIIEAREALKFPNSEAK